MWSAGGVPWPLARVLIHISNRPLCMDIASRSRRLFRARFAIEFATSAIRGRGECRAPDAPAAARGVVNTRVSHHGHTENTRHSPRNGFNGFLRALLGDRAFLPPSPLRSLLLKNLMPASGHQDHTTSPSASKAPSSEAPLASIASRPAFVTIASRPSVRRDGRIRKGDLPDGESGKFFARELDTKIAGQPVGQITQEPQPVGMGGAQRYRSRPRVKIAQASAYR
jgi:hypothetical protein